MCFSFRRLPFDHRKAEGDVICSWRQSLQPMNFLSIPRCLHGPRRDTRLCFHQPSSHHHENVACRRIYGVRSWVLEIDERRQAKHHTIVRLSIESHQVPYVASRIGVFTFETHVTFPSSRHFGRKVHRVPLVGCHSNLVFTVQSSPSPLSSKVHNFNLLYHCQRSSVVTMITAFHIALYQRR